MPDDPVDWVMRWLWPGADSSTRRAYRSGLLGVQGATDLGGGSPGVAAAAGPGEAAGVQSPTKGGGMSDDREARRLAVEAAARAWTGIFAEATDDMLTVQARALRAAVRRLDAPRYEVQQHHFQMIVARVQADRNDLVARCDTRSDAERIATLLNDAEGRP